MQFEPIEAPIVKNRTRRRDVVLGLALAAFMSLCWAARHWTDLGRLILPDPDDMMRLAQVRDWIAGQATNDWTQHRMAPPLGAPMHWSRVNDVVPAALILVLRPLLGVHAAEIAMVMIYPFALFALNIVLAARIARRLWSSQAAPIAQVMACVACSGNTIFFPGRIDHHALQVVLIETLVLAAMRRPSWRSGALAGLAAALGLAIGLEAAPQTAALIVVLFAKWAVDPGGERGRIAGFAGTLAAVTGLLLAFLRPSLWSPALCDAFTPASTTLTLAGCAALALLVVAAPVLASWQRRAAVGVVLGIAVLAATLVVYPACLTGPYGAVNPLLLREFFPYIGEARSLFAMPFAQALAIGGLPLAGCCTGVWCLVRRPRRWPVSLPVVALVVVSGLITLVQARGTYLGAPLSAPVMAGLVVLARQRATWRLPAVVGAWLMGAGIAYLEIAIAGEKLLHHGHSELTLPSRPVDCNKGDTWAEVDRYPPGLAMAPITMAAYSIGASHLSTVGAGYHRDNAGNVAVYRFFMARPEQAIPIARAWRASYVLFCPGDFSEMGLARRFPHSVGARMQDGRTPPGFERLPLPGSPLQMYRLEP